ncbi:Gastric inhibitory polypeptide [Scophthalmus maximus]|uniref:Gastric inhibitory polypeptide n=1 Tax=Scophthalmus maximus TaxID=52904 RepID=A0A2U9CNA6_SCOMX|nr:gastric inhibitory polypeptide [Scophthalmus maximus]AWP18094.1 Gastric inhibitory polypeptide [Scophthalmus maximus]
MKAALFDLLVILCLFAVLRAGANTHPEDMGEDEQHVGKRYAESTIASEMSKIVDSMAQRSFIDFLLNQKVKRSRLVAVEEDPDHYNELLKLYEKQRRES